MMVPNTGVLLEAFREELGRVMASETFRNSESLRRLLAYLADAYEAGTARDLKEYAIGRDVLGKPADYDPRVDASVRVQIGRLRQRLEQYYQTEGAGSTLQIHLPKGHFELVAQQRPATEVKQATGGRSVRIWKWAAIGLGATTLVMLALSLYWWRQAARSQGALAAWPSEMREFWGPFVEGRRPLMVVLGTPLFVRFHSHYFRNPWANEWPQVEQQVPLAELAKLLKSPTAPSPTHRWTPLGEAVAAFRLGTMLAPVKQDLVLKRSTVLAWEDVRSNNLVFLGPPKFNRQLRDLPLRENFIIADGGVTNLDPRLGELRIYRKPSPPDADEIPEDYAVITRVRSVEGWGDILVLASTSTEGTWAAAEFVTSPAYLRQMRQWLGRDVEVGTGSYQVVLRCRFKAQVPIHTEYVTHRVLAPADPAAQ